MDTLKYLIDLALHLDKHLLELTTQYGGWTYGVLFLIVFCETGLVVTPFLPGDSLLFAAGAIAALEQDGQHPLNVYLMSGLLIIASILGDALNYHIGQFFGPRVLKSETSWLFNKKHLDRTQRFFEKYGGKTIVLSRFMPIVRTLAPFVAGAGSMNYRRFFVFNIFGGILWVTCFVSLGYWFGNKEIVKKNFSLVILGIIFLSILPGVIEYFLERRRTGAKAATPNESQNETPT